MTASEPAKARICLVSPSHPASNPRLVKEATALANAGYDVRVVAARTFPLLDALDAAILRAAPGRWTLVDATRGLAAFASRARRHFWRRALTGGARMTAHRAGLAVHAAVPRMARIAAAKPADLYIGHTLGGLAAAAWAAGRRASRLGFDAEDFHAGETLHVESDAIDGGIVHVLEKIWLPQCTHLTASSPPIADAYQSKYDIRRPVPVLNVFPLSEAPPAITRPFEEAGDPRLYWFSQTIGPDRGLEPLIAALGRMRTHVALHLRGNPVAGQVERLQQLSEQQGFRGELKFLPLAKASEMATLAADYTLGLSLEQSPPRNKALCLGNKIFTYLLAGIPVALSPTPAQRQLADDLGEAALLVNIEDPANAAATLDTFLSDPSRRAAARAAARRLAEQRYNWEYEQQHLLASVRAALDSPAAAPSRQISRST